MLALDEASLRQWQADWKYMNFMAGWPVLPPGKEEMEDLRLPEDPAPLRGIKFLPDAVAILAGGSIDAPVTERLIREAARAFNRDMDPRGIKHEPVDGGEFWTPPFPKYGRIVEDHEDIVKAAEKLRKAIEDAHPTSLEMLRQMEGFNPGWLDVPGELASYSRGMAENLRPLTRQWARDVTGERFLIIQAQRLLLLAGKPHGCTVRNKYGERFHGPVAKLADAIHRVATNQGGEENWILDHTESFGSWRRIYVSRWNEWQKIYPSILEHGEEAEVDRGRCLFAEMGALLSDWLAKQK